MNIDIKQINNLAKEKGLTFSVYQESNIYSINLNAGQVERKLFVGSKKDCCNYIQGWEDALFQFLVGGSK